MGYGKRKENVWMGKIVCHFQLLLNKNDLNVYQVDIEGGSFWKSVVESDKVSGRDDVRQIRLAGNFQHSILRCSVGQNNYVVGLRKTIKRVKSKRWKPLKKPQKNKIKYGNL